MSIRDTIIGFAFVLPLGVFGQVQTSSMQSIEQSNTFDLGFENYCLKESISYIEVGANKSSGIIFSGEVDSQELNSNSTHSDYGILLKEEETQYFKLTGSNKILSVKSLFVLRLNYTNSTKSN